MDSSWRDRSQQIINQRLLEYEAQQLLLSKPIDYQAALTNLSRHEYPFSWKGGWAYTSWLKAIRWSKARCAEGWDAARFANTDWKWWERSQRKHGLYQEDFSKQMSLFEESI